MRFKVYQSSLGCRLSRVKVLILKRLWDEGVDFPRGWVTSEELLSLTQQKYFDRRVRELRDEAGCDIVTAQRGTDHLYRLNSAKVNSTKPRRYLSESQKRALFEANKYRCITCGRIVSPGVRGLQADHKIPLSRGGTHETTNWQPLCVECNVAKRRACAGCNLDCLRCPWAFPERLGCRVQLTLSAELESKVQAIAQQADRPVSEVLLGIITAALARGNRF
jgi:5-methylcytosine-specific restriction endonuclease McrA